MSEALALLELRSLARGLRSLDTLVKKAPVEILEANLIEPGRFLILFAGGVAEVQASLEAALITADDDIVDQMLLADAHPALLAGLRGTQDLRPADEMDCLGVIEGQHVASTLRACDRSLKDAVVSLAGLRVAGALGGKAYYIVFGEQHDVETALETAKAQLGARHCRTECIARPHDEMVSWLLRPAPFTVG